jgi:DNA-binding MarR family transcriptional regulator
VSDPDVDLEAMTDDILDASRPLLAIAVRTMAGAGPQITAIQYRALIILSRLGPLNLKQLAERLGLQSPSVTRLCDRLVRKGLITRRPSPASARYVELALTDDGAQIIDAVFAARRAAIRSVLLTLTPQERLALREAFTTFAAAARRLRLEGLASAEPEVDVS